jgi:membrane protein YqaA with SNARE-associated domain
LGVIGVAAGAPRYPLWGFLAAVGMGKLLKFLVFAYACAYSIQWIINVFRV